MQSVTSLGGIYARECHLCVPRMKAFLREVLLGWTGGGEESFQEQCSRSWANTPACQRMASAAGFKPLEPTQKDANTSHSGWHWEGIQMHRASSPPPARPFRTGLLFIYVIHIIPFILLWLKMRCMSMNHWTLAFFLQFPLWLQSEKNTKTGEPTPCSNLSCHDSSLWDTEMFRLPAKQNCWMWTFGWKIKRLRGMQKGSTSHIPGSTESNQMALTL